MNKKEQLFCFSKPSTKYSYPIMYKGTSNTNLTSLSYKNNDSTLNQG